MEKINSQDNTCSDQENTSTQDGCFAEKPLEWFVGRIVGVDFQTTRTNYEHLDVWIDYPRGKHLVGTLLEDSKYSPRLNEGEEVRVERANILSVLLPEDEWLAELKLLCAKCDVAPDPQEITFEEGFHGRISPQEALDSWKYRKQNKNA
jgi:hypothetical protein